MPRLPVRALRRASLRLALAAAALVAMPRAIAGQGLTRPWLDWRTTRTAHFDVVYPERMREWAQDVALHIESVREGVAAIVGAAPAQRVTIVVEDPSNVSNGSALPFLDAPVMFFWPVPPDPGSPIAANRGWGEILSVHEFAHIAHMTRPSRRRGGELPWRLLPVKVGPITRKAPRWVFEGYATFVEGRLTGTGRPHGVWRPAILRQWALEGKLPSYAELNGTRDFQQGSMAYLAGSAFLEWLVQRQGDASLVHLWRRMTAVQDRTFDEAFAGVFGGPPADLYGRFTAELTGKALEVERTLDSAGVREGTEVQRLAWYTGHPAASRDGRRLAVPLSFRDQPGRLVVWSTDSEPMPERERKARERALKRDPQDVPAVAWYPRPKKPVAVLRASHGRSFANPRFFADGRRLLVTRSVARGDGTSRPELFLWDTRGGRVRQVTHDAAVRWADPSPDGERAIGERCLDGLCDVVRIDLRSGRVTTVLRGAPRVGYYGPRYSPDGRQVLVSVQRGETAALLLTDDQGTAPRPIGPADGARRYDGEFAADGRALYAVSDAGGVTNIERIPLDGSAPVSLTRVTGAALAPAPADSIHALFFLSLYSKGYDLRRIALDSAPAGTPVALSPRLSPAAPVAVVPADTFPARQPQWTRGYGLGNRRSLRLVPSLGAGSEGWAPGLAIESVDPVARLAWTLQGAWANRGLWSGGALAATWRGWRPALEGELFALRQRPSESRQAEAGIAALDTRMDGARLGLSLGRPFGWRAHRYRLGVAASRLRPEVLDSSLTRTLAYAELASAYAFGGGKESVSFGLDLQGSSGRTAGRGWRRGVASASLGLRMGDDALRGEGSVGFVNADAPPFEQMLIGGSAPTLVDPVLLTQRLTMPALPLGTQAGSQAAAFRVSLPGEVEPYWWVGSAGRAFDHWTRVIGLEARGSMSTLEGPAFAGLTGLSALAGVGYPLDGALRHHVQGYVTLRWRP